MKRKTTLWRGDLFRADRGNLQHFKQRYFVLEGREVAARPGGEKKNVRYTLSYWRRAEDYAASVASEEYEMLQQSQRKQQQQQQHQKQGESSYSQAERQQRRRQRQKAEERDEERDGTGERDELLEQREQRARNLAQTARDRMTTAQRVKDAFRGMGSDGRVAAKWVLSVV